MPNLVLSLTNGIVLTPRVGESSSNAVMGVESPDPIVVPSGGDLLKLPAHRVKFSAGGLVAVDGGVQVPAGIYSATVNFEWASTDLDSRIAIGSLSGTGLLPFSNAQSRDLEGSYTVFFEVKSPTTVFALGRQNSGLPVALLTVLLSVLKIK